jgi:hypothetical protein
MVVLCFLSALLIPVKTSFSAQNNVPMNPARYFLQ